MYKCSDCGRKYQEKPEFCECGNNVFEEIIINTAPKRTVQREETNQLTSDNKDDRFYILLGAIIFIMIFFALIFVGVKNINSKSKSEVKTAEVKEAQQVKNENITVENQSAPKVIKQVFVDTLTNLAPKPATEQVQKPVQPVKTASQPKKTETAKNTAKEVKKQQTNPSKTAPKTVKPVNTTSTSSQPKPQQPATGQVQKPKQQQPTIPQKTAPQSAQPSAQLPNLKIPAQTPVQTPVSTAALKKELLQYKISLRNKISADINFINVIGDGTCVITFKIDSSGKLTNRAFAKQSDNDSLNDAVYSAIMRHPAFNPPPAGYKNETLRLTVKKFGSNFEVDLS